MSKENLNEQINRIKQLLNINESSVIEEAKNPIMDVIRKLVPGLERKVTKALEAELGKKIAASTDQEIEVALKSATMAATRKELAAAIYVAEKNMIDNVFGKYNMTVASEASKAYSELQSNGLNKGILKDIVGEWKAGGKAGGKAGSTSVTPTPPSPKPNNPTNTFKIPDIEIEIPDFWKMDDKATRSALKNVFPKAASSDLEKIVSNLRNMKLTNQADFDTALKNAVAGFGPEYKNILTKESTWSKVSSRYAGLPKWGKIIFWVSVSPVGYNLLKKLGIPVDKYLGSVIEGWKGMFKDQVSSVTGDTTNNNSNNNNNNNNSGNTPQFADSVDGVKDYFKKTFNYTDEKLRSVEIKSLGASKYEVKMAGYDTKTFTYANGTFTY